MDDQTHSTNGHDKNGNRNDPETMFDSLKVAANDLAERAGPTVRDLSARAADLTATAADKAAPLVRRAGAATADASVKLAEAARGWAADLRREQATSTATQESGAPSATAVADQPQAIVDTTPSELAAEEPQAVADTPPFESAAETTYEGMPASPAFEEGADSGDDAGARPGI